MGLRLNRLLVDGTHWVDPGAGEYTRSTWPHQGETICIGCPLCGEPQVLDQEKHVVDCGGRVTPAWRCDQCPCIEWIELDGVQ